MQSFNLRCLSAVLVAAMMTVTPVAQSQLITRAFWNDINEELHPDATDLDNSTTMRKYNSSKNSIKLMLRNGEQLNTVMILNTLPDSYNANVMVFNGK